MYKEIPKDKLNKALELMNSGHSIRSAAQFSGISFVSARKLKHGLPVGVKWQKRSVQDSFNRFFNVNEKCWITGLKFWE